MTDYKLEYQRAKDRKSDNFPVQQRIPKKQNTTFRQGSAAPSSVRDKQRTPSWGTSHPGQESCKAGGREVALVDGANTLGYENHGAHEDRPPSACLTCEAVCKEILLHKRMLCCTNVMTSLPRGAVERGKKTVLLWVIPPWPCLSMGSRGRRPQARLPANRGTTASLRVCNSSEGGGKFLRKVSLPHDSRIATGSHGDCLDNLRQCLLLDIVATLSPPVIRLLVDNTGVLTQARGSGYPETVSVCGGDCLFGLLVSCGARQKV